MQRYFLYLSYDGAAYHGWQVQPNGSSVQQTLGDALSTIMRRSVEVVGAGRTDAGVHARMMVAHFDAEQPLPDDLPRLADKLNRLLPPDVAVSQIRPVTAEAHARFSATQRTYQYFVCLGKQPFVRHYAYRLPRVPDFGAMNRAAALLLQCTDFTSFSKLHTDVKTNTCHVSHAAWQQQDPASWVFTIKADRFLRNMVRAVVGTLLEVGYGKMDVNGFEEVIGQRNRCSAGTSVPGHALFLTHIAYPDNIFI